MAACVTLDLDEIAEAKILDASGVERLHRHRDVASPRPTAAREAGLAGPAQTGLLLSGALRK